MRDATGNGKGDAKGDSPIFAETKIGKVPDKKIGKVPVLPTIGKPACLAKVRREDLRSGEVLCNHCTAKCCRYFALPIDKPKTWEDFDYIRWYLLHERASIFTDEGSWYLLVHNECKHLRADQLCDIYETRPQICRDYTTNDCEYDDEWVYDHYWETPEQIEEYAEALLGPRGSESIRSAKPQAVAACVPNP
jgi:uncharacterized protein